MNKTRSRLASLMLALLLALSITTGALADASIDSNIYSLSEDERNELEIESLPSSLIDAIRELKADTYIRDCIGEHIYKKYSHAKRKEWNSYNKRVSQWEIDEYLGRY